MHVSMSSRGLVFRLAVDRSTITVSANNVACKSGLAVVLTRWKTDTVLEDPDDFLSECEKWSADTDSDTLNALRKAAGAYPMERREYVPATGLWRVYITVAGVGSASRVTDIAKWCVGDRMNMVDREPGRRTVDGIEYAFTFRQKDDPKIHWCSGWNEPGYLPEPPEIVQHGGSLDDNIEYLIMEMQRHRNHAYDTGNPELAKDFDAELADIAAIKTDELMADALFGRRDKGHWDVLVGGTAYWIMPCHTVDCDQIMTNE